MLTTRLLISALLLISLSCAAIAGVPGVISYQGKLMQPSGAPVPDGAYSIQFAIYDVPSGGTPFWSETNPSVQVKGGLFATMLGSVVNLPANIFDNAERWFAIKVNSDPEMVPRQRIASAAFAFRAAIASTVDDGAVGTGKIANSAVTADKLAPGVAIPPGGVIMWSGATASIPQGWALCDGTNGTPDLRDRFVVGAGAGYATGATGGVTSLDLSHSHLVSNHSHGISADGNHSHSASLQTAGIHEEALYFRGNTLWGPSGIIGRSAYAPDDQVKADSSVSASGGHSHSGVTGAAAPGTDSRLGAVENRPPYYALCFIMKLGY